MSSLRRVVTRELIVDVEEQETRISVRWEEGPQSRARLRVVVSDLLEMTIAIGAREAQRE